MTVKSSQRGHTIVFQDIWRYEDGKPATIERPCVRCGRMPIKGRDACVGHVPGASSVCCGHGVGPEYKK